MSYLTESDSPVSSPDPSSAIAWLGDLKRVSTWHLQALAAPLCPWEKKKCPLWEKQHGQYGASVTAAGLWPLHPWAGASGVTHSATHRTLCPCFYSSVVKQNRWYVFPTPPDSLPRWGWNDMQNDAWISLCTRDFCSGSIPPRFPNPS